MSISIVIVEDLDEVREGLKNFLSLSTDFTISASCKTAEDALVCVPELNPDIVMMDINLPGMSGIDCVRALRSKTAATQYIMFTVYENDEKVFEALKAGASGYLLKNTGLLQIEESLKELYKGGSPMSANIARKLVKNFYEQHELQADSTYLSPRENEVLHLLAQGFLYKEIADRLTISTSTVRQHIHKIYEKLHVQNRTEAINKAYRRP
jgi:DNA-binding NarL/FixJ family response regulator